MPMTAVELLEAANALSQAERDWLLRSLLTQEEAAWNREAGEPEPGYEEWFRAGVEEALMDTSTDTPHPEVVEEMANLLRASREANRRKASA